MPRRISPSQFDRPQPRMSLALPLLACAFLLLFSLGALAERKAEAAPSQVTGLSPSAGSARSN